MYVSVGEAATNKGSTDYAESVTSSPVTSLQVLQASRLAAAAAAARQHAFYSRVLSMSRPAGAGGDDSHACSAQSASARCPSTHAGVFLPVSAERFHPYDRRL